MFTRVAVVYLFFFFKQKTAYEMRISDWSSDVCSSDLAEEALRGAVAEDPGNAHLRHLLANAIAERQGSLDEAVRHIEQAVRLDGGKAEHHHLRGLIELRRGRPAAAEAALARAIALNPSVPWWRYQLAQSLFRQGKWARAREVLDGFIALSPASADAFQLLGRLCTELGEDAAAAEAFRRCAALKPDWAWPHLKLAQLDRKSTRLN